MSDHRYGQEFGQPHPLRPYYVPPADDFSPTFRPAQPSYSHNAYVYHDDAVDVSSSSAESMRGVANNLLIKYAATALANPFEVANTLMQVQYLPSDEQDLAGEPGIPLEEHIAESDGEDDVDAYFYDPTRGETGSSNLDPSQPRQSKLKKADQSGYLIRSSVYDDATRPVYQLPPQPHTTFGMLSALWNHPSEGWSSLAKGLFPSFLFNVGFSALQPLLAEFISGALDIPLVDFEHPYRGISILVFSHLIPGLLLSPLDLVTTRLVVQPRQSPHKRYRGTVHCLRASAEEEGGLINLITAPRFLIPTTLYHVVPTFFNSFLHLQAERKLGVPRPDTMNARASTVSPVVRNLSEFIASTAELATTMPLDTIRRRLQVQVNTRTLAGAAAMATVPYRGCVELRQRPYAGVVDCVYRIITEEGRQSAVARRLKRVTKTGDPDEEPRPTIGSRLGGLYRGFGMAFTMNTVVFALGLVAGEDGEGWQDF